MANFCLTAARWPFHFSLRSSHIPKNLASWTGWISCCPSRTTVLGARRARQVQNYIVNLQVNYNTSRASDLLTTLSLRPQTFVPKDSRSVLIRRVSSEHNLPSRPLPCLLLKPISAHYANCPICSPYRPTRASVLLGYIEGVSVASIICHAPRL